MTAEKKKKQLGEILKEKGIITEDHIKYALQIQKITKDRLGEIFEKLGFVTLAGCFDFFFLKKTARESP